MARKNLPGAEGIAWRQLKWTWWYINGAILRSFWKLIIYFLVIFNFSKCLFIFRNWKHVKFLFLGEKNHPIIMVLHDIHERRWSRVGCFFFLNWINILRSIGREKWKENKEKWGFVFYLLFLSKGSYICRFIVRIRYNVFKIFRMVPIGAQ